MNKNEIYITGFTPFLNNKYNPTCDIIMFLKNKGYRVTILDVTYTNADDFFRRITNDSSIKFVLSLGLAAKRERISIEEFAYNEINQITPDNNGVIPEESVINKDFPYKVKTNIDVTHFSDIFKANSFPFEISSDPGRYLCNYVYYNCLIIEHLNSLFIHFPNIKSPLDLKKFQNITLMIINEVLNQKK
jgi:Pyrrolidone-carboxylate peptidase (N-terminal pyroglutamyl peptidase)